jgi:hypothetical protein
MHFTKEELIHKLYHWVTANWDSPQELSTEQEDEDRGNFYCLDQLTYKPMFGTQAEIRQVLEDNNWSLLKSKAFITKRIHDS